MKVIEYQVKVPVVSFNNYDALLRSVLFSENPAVVNLLDSGMSDYARLPNSRNKNRRSIFRTVKLYNLVSEPEIKVVSFYNHPYYNTTVSNKVSGDQFTLYMACDTQEEKPNRFLLPLSLLDKRTKIVLDLTDPTVWNTTNTVSETILGTQTPTSPPPPPAVTFVYGLIVTPSLESQVEETVAAYLVLLHRRMIELL